jgi:Ca-activated chloride channel family protein
MTFADPHFFWLFTIGALLLIWLIFLRKRRTIMFPFAKWFHKSGSFSGKSLKMIRGLLMVIAFTLFVIVLARPQLGTTTEQITEESLDILLAIDVSESMLAEDLKPNRLEAAKTVLDDFLTRIEGNRVGIIVFSGKPFTQSPLTFDTNIIREYLGNITTDSIQQTVRGLNGTAIGDAILAAANRFESGEDEAKNAEADEESERSKVLILLTDGEANTGVDPIIAANYAKENNIKIYTIGMGQEGGAPLYTRDILGNRQVARDRNGRVIMSTFDEAALKEIATIVNGKYFRADDNQALQVIFEQIEELEKTEIEVNATTIYNDRYQPFLAALIIVLLLLLLARSRQLAFP